MKFILLSALLALSLILSTTSSAVVPPELFSPLIPQKIFNTTQSLPSPIQYPQYTTTWNVTGKPGPGVWLDFVPNTWTSGFFPASLYALNTRKALCGGTSENDLGIADWLQLGRSTSTGLIPLETNNTLEHDVGFVSFPFSEELLMYVFSSVLYHCDHSSVPETPKIKPPSKP